ncbi:hypothetical protein JRO89_XS09G0236900 [Xanthoceras sorbifolium]|uniref:NB-ARC domain-containing protein n=1 Tax=Xanthoceras sorbifolium TaxID=99658 RepID=A0ABQ8HMQ0_9ROSI|nr:hypothetical protein JRO89_XS09G0236900 [Xanthoceras sorbifolium]
MDAKASAFILMKKLPLIFPDLETSGDSSFGEQIKNNLRSLNQLLRDEEEGRSEASCGAGGGSMDDQKTTRLLQALYSAACAIDSFRLVHWMSKSSKKRISFSLWFKSLRSRKHLIIEMRGFNEEMIRCLSSYDDNHRNSVAKNKAASVDGGIEDVVKNYTCQQRWGRISGLCEETDVVGIRQRTTNKLLIGLTAQDELNQEQFSGEIVEEVRVNGQQDQVLQDQSSVEVIAVVGEGGSGKTTLARSVYDRVDVRRHFTNRAWVHVPDVFKARDVLAEIVKQIDQSELTGGEETLSAEDLVWKVTKLLDGTRFLIVLDDVNTPEVWETLLSPICSSPSQSGGRIVVTTRDVAGSFPPQATYAALHLGRLNGEESWKLFSNKVRISEDELNNSEMITLKDQILNICGGLPSTIALLGGLLSTKRQSYSEWSRVLILQQRANEAGEDVLALSYQDLPSLVKPCFIYMGLFPRGFEIPVRRLLHLWCAEGFVTPSTTEELDREDLEEFCFEELVIRNMVQVRLRLDGCPKTCCMSNVLYDFFSRKAENVGFFYHHFHHQSSPESSAAQPKLAVWRLASYLGIKHFPYSYLDILNLRSYTAFDTRIRGTPAREIGMLLNKIVSSRGFGLVTVLDLEGVYKPKLSDDVVSKMLLLSYLGLRSTFIDELPAAVTDLAYLETLDLKHTNIRTKYLAFKSERLRHVYLNSHFNFEYLGMRSNSSMQTLWGVYFIVQRNFIRKWVQSFTRLRKLKLIGWPTLASDEIAEWISKLTHLQSLKLVSISDDSKLASSITLCPLKEHHKLHELYLTGIVPKSVFDVGFLPPNLSKLTLSLSQLRDDPMLLLGHHQLQHLKILRLFGCTQKLVKQMTCMSSGFPKLQLLQLWNLPINKLTVEAGAMPCLRELEIRSCQQLEEVTGLQNVTTLKELVLTNMPADFGAKVGEILKGSGDVYIRYNSWSSSPPFMGPNYRNERSKDWAPYDV